MRLFLIVLLGSINSVEESVDISSDDKNPPTDDEQKSSAEPTDKLADQLAMIESAISELRGDNQECTQGLLRSVVDRVKGIGQSLRREK